VFHVKLGCAGQALGVSFVRLGADASFNRLEAYGTGSLAREGVEHGNGHVGLADLGASPTDGNALRAHQVVEGM
jgi:hypothetical protein